MNEEKDKEIVRLKAENGLLRDVNKMMKKLNKTKDKIIIFLIFCMCVMTVGFVIGHEIYESQFYTVEEAQDENGVEIKTDGDNASAEYNNVGGDQYNDNAIHEEGSN